MNTHQQTFETRLANSHAAVLVVAREFQRAGYLTKVTKPAPVPAGMDPRKYWDPGDLHIALPGGPSKWLRVEVKHRPHLDFQGPDDFPPGWDGLFIYAKRTYDRMLEKPRWVVIVNQSMTLCAAIDGRSAEKWEVRETDDRGYPDRYVQERYWMPFSVFKWLPLGQRRS